MKWILLLMFFFVSGQVLGEERFRFRAAPEVTLGTEFDAFPFVTGGYYFSLIVGEQYFRLRGIVAEVTRDEPPGFSHSSVVIRALLLDYFFSTDYEGFWLGGGFQNWSGRLTEKVSGTTGTYGSWITAAEVGYHWFFYDHFYLSPWIAVYGRMAGDSKVIVGDQKFKVPDLQAVASLKIGWYF